MQDACDQGTLGSHAPHAQAGEARPYPMTSEAQTRPPVHIPLPAPWLRVCFHLESARGVTVSSATEELQKSHRRATEEPLVRVCRCWDLPNIFQLTAAVPTELHRRRYAAIAAA